MRATKSSLRPADPELSPEFLAAQRRSVHDRMGRSSTLTARLAPALAAAFLLAIGLFLFQPRAQHQTVHTTPKAVVAQIESVSNEQLFSDLQSMEESFEPRAAAPLHALFEGSGDSGVQ